MSAKIIRPAFADRLPERSDLPTLATRALEAKLNKAADAELHAARFRVALIRETKLSENMWFLLGREGLLP